MRTENMDADAVEELVNRRSGMLGVSETSPDMRDLLDRRATDPRAALAVDLFCYQARKSIAALAAVLGGIDTLIFSGGIGENSAQVRDEICRDLGFLGIELDPRCNRAGAGVISPATKAATVRVLKTDEESLIA